MFGVLSSTIFITSAITSGVIRSKIRRGQATQQASVGVAPTPTTFVMVQQPITSHPTQSVVEGGATGYPPPAYYSTIGEGGTPRYYARPGPAGVGGGVVVGEPYYSQPLPQSTPGVYTTADVAAKSSEYGEPPSYVSITA